LHDGVSHPSGVTVTVPARLHLGFLDLNGELGRKFGGIGLAIGELRTRLTLRRASSDTVEGPEGERVRHCLAAMRRALGLGSGGYAVHMAEAVPPHAGLGSGTQLALAVAAALRRLHGLPLDVEADAVTLGRGKRSGIGIGLFTRGGLVVDGGHAAANGANAGVAPVVSHLPFPEAWRILVVLDPRSRGVHGADEISAFAALAPMQAGDAADICRHVLMQALPALAERDLQPFGAAIEAVQKIIGDYFAAAQGGARFASRAVAAVLESLDQAGAHGVGQSSWGPTGFAFAASQAEAERLATLARRHDQAQGLDIRICAGLNRGAEIVAHAPAHE
jgi:beta-ribofuranosylaminobenzene 5'-phosphate synthase